MSWVQITENGIRVFLIITPNASKSEVVGPYGEPPALKIRLSAKAVDGKANKALIEFMSKKIGISKNQIQLEKGHKSRLKCCLIKGIQLDQVNQLYSSNSDSSGAG